MSSSNTTNSSPAEPRQRTRVVLVVGRSQPRHCVVSTNRVGQPFREQYQQLVAGAVPQTVVDMLEAIQIDEQHREAVVRMAAAADHRALEPFHEQGAIRQPGQRIVRRVVNELPMRHLQAGAHAVERARDGDGLDRPILRQLELKVAGGDFRRGRRDVLQRAADPTAEYHPASQRQAQHHQARPCELASKTIDERLRRLPVREQQQTTRVTAGLGPAEREYPGDIGPITHSKQIGAQRGGGKFRRGQHECVGRRAGAEAHRHDTPLRDQDDLTSREVGQLLRELVRQAISERQRAEDFVGEARRDGHGQEQRVTVRDDLARRGSRQRRGDRAVQAAPGSGRRALPPGIGGPRSGLSGDYRELRVQLLAVPVGHRLDVRPIHRPAGHR